jgi:two-component system, chemotaxis family, response regulator Rcp1
MPHDFHILLVDDSATDAKIIERALRESRAAHTLTVLRDGRDALEHLRRLHAAAEPAPDLILLDLNLPGLDGGQVLVEIKSDPALRVIPVVVLTTSRRDEDVVQTYRAGANTYIQKPSEYPRYRDLVAILSKYWHETALRAPRHRPGG